MSSGIRIALAVSIVFVFTLGLAACDGEGTVTSEGGGTGTGTGTGSGTGTGTGSGTGTGTGPTVSIEGAVNNHGSETLSGASAELEVEADDNYFAPTFVQAEPGATITLTLHNEGQAAHTFTIDELDIDEQLDVGATAEVDVELAEDGPVVFYCRFHRADGMQGAFDLAAG